MSWQVIKEKQQVHTQNKRNLEDLVHELLRVPVHLFIVSFNCTDPFHICV